MERTVAARKKATRRYSKKASEKVGAALHEMKEGTLRSGGPGNKVKTREQVIAIGLSEARREGAEMPPEEKRPKAKAASSKPRGAKKALATKTQATKGAAKARKRSPKAA